MRTRWWALGVIALCVLVLGLDATVLLTALPTLAARLGATTDGLQWIVDAYTLALGGLLVPAGALADRYGRRRLLLAGLLIFGLSSVAASQATSTSQLIIARAVMGIGGAIVMPVSFSIVPTLFTEAERPRALAALAGGTFVGLPLGPLVAGWLLAHFDWGSIFLINVPVVAAALVGTWFLVPESRDEQAGRIDVVGALLVVAASTALVYGIIEEPVAGWTDVRVAPPLVGGAVMVVAFALWERRQERPLVDLGWFRDRTFSWATFNFAMVGAAMFGVLFVLTPYLQLVQGNDVQGTGARLLPVIAGLMAGALPTDRLSARLGRRPLMAGGLAVTAGGALLLATAGTTSGFAIVGAAEFVIGMGLGLAMPPALDAILSTLPENQVSVGSALTRAIQNVSASFGVALLGSLLNSGYRSRIDGHLAGLPPAAAAIVEGGLGQASAVAAHLPAAAGHPLLEAARSAYVGGMAEVLVAAAALMLAAAAATLLFFPSRSRTIEAWPASASSRSSERAS